LKEQINDKYEHFLEDGSVLSNIFKSMLIQVDMKEKFKEILEEILFKMEELSDEEWLLDINNINNFIYHLKENKGPIIQKVKNLFLKPRDDILKNDERLFRKYENFKISKDLIENFDEEKYENMRGYVDKLKSLIEYKNNSNIITNKENNYNIKHFYNALKISNNDNIVMQIYEHYFLIIRKILHFTIDTFILKINYFPNIIKSICKMIFILTKNSYRYKLTNFDILTSIGKFILNQIIKLYLYDNNYTVMLDFFPSSIYSKKNSKLLKTILSTLQRGDFFSKDNFPNLIPFNALFYEELLPKLINFYKSLINVEFSDYINDLISGVIDENDFSYDFFETNPEEIFSNMSICFNIKNYHSFLTLFKIYTLERQDRREFYKRGDKNCINNMKQYFGAVGDYKDLKIDENVFYLYYNNLSEEFDFENIKNDTQIVYSIPEKNVQEIESQEEFNENQIVKMKNRLCLLLYKINDLNINDYTQNEKSNFTKMIRKIILISKEEIIGKTLKILIDKINKTDNEELNNQLFNELSNGIKDFSDELEDSFLKMEKANENLRAIKLNIKKIIKYNEELLFYNSYLGIEEILNSKYNFNQFINKIFTIQDTKLNEYYKQKIIDDFISKKMDVYPGDVNDDKKNSLQNYPCQIIELINYIKLFKEKYSIEYFFIFIDYISSIIYDKIIIHEPDNDDIIIFNTLIKDKIIYKAHSKDANLNEKIINDLKLLFKKYNILKGPCQKIRIINELIEIFTIQNAFIKGKKELLELDDIIKYMCYIISKIYPNSLIRLSKYLSMFGNNEKSINTLEACLVKIRNDCVNVNIKKFK